MIEGRIVNLRIMEKEDVPLFTEWFNNTEFLGEYFSPSAPSRAEVEKFLESALFETKGFFIEKKDGSKIGYIWHFNVFAPYGKMLELGYGLVPNERGKGYCTEAARALSGFRENQALALLSPRSLYEKEMRMRST